MKRTTGDRAESPQCPLVTRCWGVWVGVGGARARVKRTKAWTHAHTHTGLTQACAHTRFGFSLRSKVSSSLPFQSAELTSYSTESNLLTHRESLATAAVLTGNNMHLQDSWQCHPSTLKSHGGRTSVDCSTLSMQTSSILENQIKTLFLKWVHPLNFL